MKPEMDRFRMTVSKLYVKRRIRSGGLGKLFSAGFPLRRQIHFDDGAVSAEVQRTSGGVPACGSRFYFSRGASSFEIRPRNTAASGRLFADLSEILVVDSGQDDF